MTRPQLGRSLCLSNAKWQSGIPSIRLILSHTSALLLSLPRPLSHFLTLTQAHTRLSPTLSLSHFLSPTFLSLCLSRVTFFSSLNLLIWLTWLFIKNSISKATLKFTCELLRSQSGHHLLISLFFWIDKSAHLLNMSLISNTAWITPLLFWGYDVDRKWPSYDQTTWSDLFLLSFWCRFWCYYGQIMMLLWKHLDRIGLGQCAIAKRRAVSVAHKGSSSEPPINFKQTQRLTQWQ